MTGNKKFSAVAVKAFKSFSRYFLRLTARPSRQHRQPNRCLVIHSDRGVQYACTGFRQYLQRYGFVQSMIQKANCWDNAVAESFFHLLKIEFIHHYTWYGYADVHSALFEYIELFFN